MNRIETVQQLGDEGRQPLPIEVLERGKREREFFDQYTDPAQIPDELLRIPETLERIDLPAEVLRLVPHLSGKRVCEFGCGYGVTSSYFALKGAVVSGFDISQSNISVALRAARVNGVESRVDFQIMQAESTTYSADSFDFIFGNGVLHHLDLKLTALEIFRLLKPGGIAVFLDPLGESRLLEWARDCPLRASNRKHTPDEHSLRYADIELLRPVFPQMSYRERGLLTVVKSVFRKVEAGMIAIPRAERVLESLSRFDNWLLKAVPFMRPFAQHVVISLPKPGDVNLAGSSDLAKVLEFHGGSPLSQGR